MGASKVLSVSGLVRMVGWNRNPTTHGRPQKLIIKKRKKKNSNKNKRHSYMTDRHMTIQSPLSPSVGGGGGGGGDGDCGDGVCFGFSALVTFRPAFLPLPLVFPASASRITFSRAMARSSPCSAALTYHTFACSGSLRQPIPCSVKYPAAYSAFGRPVTRQPLLHHMGAGGGEGGQPYSQALMAQA